MQWIRGGEVGVRTSNGAAGPLLVAVAPAFLWTFAISCLPHKEERFLYVVYPLVRACRGRAHHTVLPRVRQAAGLPCRFSQAHVFRAASVFNVGSDAVGGGVGSPYPSLCRSAFVLQLCWLPSPRR